MSEFAYRIRVDGYDGLDTVKVVSEVVGICLVVLPALL